jgi:hypothetical protein
MQMIATNFGDAALNRGLPWRRDDRVRDLDAAHLETVPLGELVRPKRLGTDLWCGRPRACGPYCLEHYRLGHAPQPQREGPGRPAG